MRDRESGIAYGLFAIVILLIGAGLMLAMMAPMINPVTSEFNKQIEQGHVSMQTANSYQWTESWFRYGMPIATILVAVMFAVIRALYRRRLDGYG